MNRQHLLRWLISEIPAILLALALAGGAWEALRSHWRGKSASPGAHLDPLGNIRLPAFLGIPFAVIAFMLPLLSVWSIATTDGCSVFGIFPYSDASNYYIGAEELLGVGKLPPWNCRRPLTSVLLAVELAVAGHDIQAVQLLHAVLMGLSAYALARVVGRDLGWPSGLSVFAILYSFGRNHVHWLSSEWLGLTIGSLGFALLWLGSRSGRKSMCWLGMVVLTLALNARAGTFLVLPALALWSGFAFREKRSFHWGATAAIAAGILLGFLVNGSIMKIYGGRFGVGHGNFSFVLYGLASGEPGWRQIYRDYPETEKMTEDDLTDFAYRKSYEWITNDPSRLIRSLVNSSKQAASNFPDLPGLDRSLTQPRIVKWFLAPFLMASALVFLWRFRRRPEVTMVAASLAGFLLSIPFLWTDGENRVYAATFPVLAVFLSYGISGWRRTADLPFAQAASHGHSPRMWPLAVAGTALIAVAVAGPALAIRASKAPQIFSLPDPGPWDSAVIRTDAPRVTVMRPRVLEETLVPRIARFDYLRNLPTFAVEDFRKLPGPGAVFYAQNRIAPADAGPFGKYIWVLGPADMVREKPQYLLLRGSYSQETRVFRVSGFSILGEATD
ncbi:MAG: hypothetical protein WC899_05735 [bacterium]|jgi:hypothetical protein